MNTHECTTRIESGVTEMTFSEIFELLAREAIADHEADVRHLEYCDAGIFPPYPEHQPKGVGCFASPKVVAATPLRRFFS